MRIAGPSRVLTGQYTESTIVAKKCSRDTECGRLFEKASRQSLVASNIFSQEVVEWLAKI
jgi:hypothetical protein